jgi:hypothetical protein
MKKRIIWLESTFCVKKAKSAPALEKNLDFFFFEPKKTFFIFECHNQKGPGAASPAKLF